MTELTITRTLAAPADRVWRALTDPAALVAWFWPQRFSPTAEVDLRVGGRYRIDGPAVGMAVSGEYVTVDPPHKLVLFEGGEPGTLNHLGVEVESPEDVAAASARVAG